MVRGIRTVKLQVWEPVWHQRVTEARRLEMRAILRVRILTAFNSLVGSVLGVMVPVSVFAWYTLVSKKTLDAATAFTALAWISTLQWSVQSLPGIYNCVANLKPSLRRIDDFLTRPIGAASWRQEPWLEHRSGSTVAVPAAWAVELQAAAFGYQVLEASTLCETCVLQGLELQIQAGSFVMIAGAVGSGKSTLLASLAGARPPLRGRCEVKGRRAFVPQKPFLLNGSVRENIVFGLPWEEERYAAALDMAALAEDLKQLTKGDATAVGESGAPATRVPTRSYKDIYNP